MSDWCTCDGHEGFSSACQLDPVSVVLTQRWIKQVEDESCSASMEDGTESTSSQQSTSSRSTPNPLSSGTYGDSGQDTEI